MGISTEGVKKHVMRALDACHNIIHSKPRRKNDKPSFAEGDK
jgi:hypothetical protein